MPTICEKCQGPCDRPENDYGEFICQNCVDNANEAAAERQYETYHDGGSGFRTLREQQIAAWKLK